VSGDQENVELRERTQAPTFMNATIPGLPVYKLEKPRERTQASHDLHNSPGFSIRR
jgi:hypothetical protein